ncbi:3-deoxy-7-phosphoheptulonate synthase [Piptocephalis cylindrospora]|uniref:Phospho-2-dehydro-3-deoxyheptonate aldolase n=1 Tax=Piptocephalis cylindrospora TaxID=1907219 RepID=A0A4P9Y8T4_9FUNG|nr:3-deoxy-7-phosphoheptulonate synthase [Piptocephalis cylindrospora]|eukprot:RKP14791.1 3-deoxy-7-phosphoheptulonate synthase [Piptocephalis cylindrospora]
MTQGYFLDDLLVESYDPLIPPQLLQAEVPLSQASKDTIDRGRAEAKAVLRRQDDRIVVIVGPCSIHDPKAAIEYGLRLKEVADRLSDDLVIIMRAYFEKPRTTVGWKGLINDPEIDGSFQINKGLRLARKLLCELTDAGIPVGSELLDTISPQFVGDLISWGAIGARTTESQLHRELASGVSFPVGFKNGTDGNAGIALDAIRASSNAHHFLGVTKQGLAAITNTSGNPDCHIILRGGTSGPNYESAWVEKTRESMTKANITPNVMVDCSHGNSRKQHKNQITACADVASQIAAGDTDVIGLMIESNLVEGRQDMPADGPSGLVYGKSITDACVHWDDTVTMLEGLSTAVQSRRKLAKVAQ